MRCPSCKQRVIDFRTWGQGVNAFVSRDCPHCRAPLRISRRTMIAFVVMLVLLIPLVILVASALGDDGGTKWGRAIFAGIMTPLAAR